MSLLCKTSGKQSRAKRVDSFNNRSIFTEFTAFEDELGLFSTNDPRNPEDFDPFLTREKLNRTGNLERGTLLEESLDGFLTREKLNRTGNLEGGTLLEESNVIDQAGASRNVLGAAQSPDEPSQIPDEPSQSFENLSLAEKASLPSVSYSKPTKAHPQLISESTLTTPIKVTEGENLYIVVLIWIALLYLIKKLGK